MQGGYYLFSSAHRVVSVGSRQFLAAGTAVLTQPPFADPFGMAPFRLEDCHIDSWTGPVAVDVGSVLQLLDCTFTNPCAARPFAPESRTVPRTVPRRGHSRFQGLFVRAG